AQHSSTAIQLHGNAAPSFLTPSVIPSSKPSEFLVPLNGEKWEVLRAGLNCQTAKLLNCTGHGVKSATLNIEH
ncbi:MAG: hypothetical protein ACK5HT_02140, partial [Draconibacterium sp.]